MAYFDISVDDFLSALDSYEMKELIESLVEDGHIPKSVLGVTATTGSCVSEIEFEEALNKLQGKWTVLSREEEEVIIKIAKRF